MPLSFERWCKFACPPQPPSLCATCFPLPSHQHLLCSTLPGFRLSFPPIPPPFRFPPDLSDFLQLPRPFPRHAGFVLVKKVPGMLHFAARSESHTFDHTLMNMSHVVHSFNFGSRPSLKKYQLLKRLHPAGMLMLAWRCGDRANTGGGGGGGGGGNCIHVCGWPWIRSTSCSSGYTRQVVKLAWRCRDIVQRERGEGGGKGGVFLSVAAPRSRSTSCSSGHTRQVRGWCGDGVGMISSQNLVVMGAEGGRALREVLFLSVVAPGFKVPKRLRPAGEGHLTIPVRLIHTSKTSYAVA